MSDELGRTDLFQVFGLLNFRLEYILLEILTPSGEKCVVIQSLLLDTNLKEKGSNIFGDSECRVREFPGMEGIVCPLGQC